MAKNFLFMVIAILTAAPAGACDYIVHRHETLSQIVQKFYPEKRLYGKKGLVRKIMSVNPQIHDPNILEVGDSIKFPKLKMECSIAMNAFKKKHHRRDSIVASKKSRKRTVASLPQDDDKPLPPKIKPYHHRLAALGRDGHVDRAIASVPQYKVPDSVVKTTPEVIATGELLTPAIAVKPPVDE